MKALSLVGECAEKSELVRRLVIELVGRGLLVSTIKRVSDIVALEKLGSGPGSTAPPAAREVMIASAGRFALLAEMPPDNTEPNVGDLLARMAPVDIILLDGFRRSRYPKMEVVPAEQDRPRLAPGDKTVLAITSDAPIAANVAWLSLKDISALADFALATSRVVAG